MKERICADNEQKVAISDNKCSKFKSISNTVDKSRQLKKWDDCSDRTKRRRKKMIKDAEEANLIQGSKETKKNVFTKEDGLHLLYGGPNGGFSKTEYQHIREASNGSYPSYLTITKFRDSILPPYSSDENTFSVKLQDTHDITTQRLFKGIQENHPERLEYLKNGDTLIFHCKTGADGQGSMGVMNVKETRSGRIQDNHLYNVAYTPVSLRTTDGQIIWQNPVPNSPYLTKPLFCGFEKESHEIILQHFHDIQTQQASLKDCVIQVSDKKINVKPMISNTMFDGKSTVEITKDITKKAISYLSCHLCGCKGSDFNNPIIYRTNHSIDPAILDLGPSVLHCKMRSMEGIFNLAVRAKTGPNYPMSSQEFIDVKKEFISAFKERMNLTLFAVHPIHGSSNNGNAADNFFLHAEETADILGLNVELIKGFNDLNNILSNSKQNYNIVQYEILARRMFRILTESPEFEGLCPMTPTMHRIIVHGAAFIKHFQQKSLDPIGALSESALESRNKHVRMFRKEHSWRGSLNQTIKDMGIRLLVTSDILLFMRRKIQLQ